MCNYLINENHSYWKCWEKTGKGSLVQSEPLQTMLNYITKAQCLTTALLSLIKEDCKLANGSNSVCKVVFLVEISSVDTCLYVCKVLQRMQSKC